MESTIDSRIRKQAHRWPSTQLGVGVVSQTTVDATIELANEHNVDVMLIPSRRQVDTDELGSGYVCNWNASRFTQYVKVKDTKRKIILCRDHGGPWQNSKEVVQKMSSSEAMRSCKNSYKEDIEAGFDVLHIDTSVALLDSPTAKDALSRLFELYEYCWELACNKNRSIAFEIGTEEQDSMSHSLNHFFNELHAIVEFCNKNKFPVPTFVVAQTGTKVMEYRNVGLLGSPYRIDGAVPTEMYVPRLIAGLNKVGIMLKQHNTDYLTNEVVGWHPHLGIHAANVAPEFGVSETMALLHIMQAFNLKKERDDFLELSYKSKKWEKWMLPDTQASDRDRSIIAGHYVFSLPAFHEIKVRTIQSLTQVGINLDSYLKDKIKEAILRYLIGFRLVGGL